MKPSSFYILILFFGICQTFLGQNQKKIIIQNADYADLNDAEMPDAFVLRGNISVVHEGMSMTCNKAYFYQKENYIKAFGNVQMVQGDTLYINSKYAEYNGNLKKAFASGNATMTTPQTTIATDTLKLDRNTQEIYYNTKGTITNKDNVLVSKKAKYYAAEKRFKFQEKVVVTNPKFVIKSDNLDYYTETGKTYLKGPSTITSDSNFIYTENGYYDTKKNLSYFLKKSYLKYDDRKIEADSLYYDRNKEFASGTRNVKITDSINKGIISGGYAEFYKNKDSLYVTKRALAANLIDNDSIFIHGKKLMVTGSEENRIIRAFNNVRFLRANFSGKCDSIHSSSKTSLTQLIGKPVIWFNENQITGDIIHLIGNKDKKIDSLKVLNNSFLVSKDSLSTGFNQSKGNNLYAKFKDGNLSEVDIVKNAEVIFYMRDDNQELIGINKNLSNQIHIEFEQKKINTITFFEQVDGNIYPEDELPEEEQKLKGFIWLGDERILRKEDLIIEEIEELPPSLNQFKETKKNELKLKE